MATEKESSCHDICANDPNFAIICSFFDRFANSCGITHPTFLELQEMIENPADVPTELVELHVKLLRKIRKSVSAEKWEKALVKFCHSYYCSEDGWELERCGYKKCKVPIKLRILKNLLDAQFDLNVKFKNDINKLTAEELRTEPLGRDKVGQSYWCQFDSAANVRVYKEDQDEETWKLVAKDREGLVDLITQLSSGEELLGLELINEDSNSQEVEKPIIDTGQVEVSTSEENTADNTSSTDSKTEHSVKQEDNSNSGSSQQNISCTNKDNNDRKSFELNLQSSTTICKTDIIETDKSCASENVDSKGSISCSIDAKDVNSKELVEKDLMESVENTKNDSTPLIPSSATIQGVGCGETILSSTKSLESANDDGLKNIDEDYSKNANTEEINFLQQGEECKSNFITTNSTITEKIEDGSNLKHIIPKHDVTIKTNLPITIEDSTKSHTPETSNINVAEEIKQRSLFKSNISSLFKGKIGKSSSGSKLDQIFSRKLEQSNVSSVIDQSFKSTTKLLSGNVTNKHEKELHSTIPTDNELFSKASVPIVDNKDCSIYIEPNSKRKPDEAIIDEQPLKKQCLEAESNDDEVGEEIEEPVMIITGEGLGRECDTGNPGREEDDVTKEKISNSSSDNDSKVINKQKQSSSNSQVSNFENCNEDLKLKNLDTKIDKLNNGIAENISPEDVHEKSIEEQLSDLTGESLSPKTNDLSNVNCNNEKQDNVLLSKQTEKGMRRKSFECTDSVDNESVPPEAKKTKVVLDDILGCLNDNSSNDVGENKFSSEDVTVERDSNTVSNNILTKESESNSSRNTETSPNIDKLENNDLIKDEDEDDEIKTSKQAIDVYKKQTVEDGNIQKPKNHVPDDKNEELQHNKCMDHNIKIQTDKEKDNSNLNEKPEQICNSTEETNLNNSEEVAKIGFENGSDNEEAKNTISDQPEEVEQNSLEENIVDKKKKSSNKFTSKASKKSVKNSRKKNSKRKNVFVPNAESNNTSDDKALVSTGDSFESKSVEDEILDDKENDIKKLTKDRTSDDEVKTDKVNNHSQENYNETNIEEPLSSKEENDNSPNKKKSNQKKSPSKRRKLFTPKSRKRTNKNQIAITEKEKAAKGNGRENEENSHENASEAQNETTDKNNSMQNDGKDVLKGGINPMSVKSRKRRNSRKNTGTEKDSEDEISDRKDDNEGEEEEEVGGKRRKIKGKRTPNKTVRKSVEEKRNIKSSSEEETQPETGNDEKEIKKTSASKKRKSPMKKSKIKEKTDSKSKTNSVQASKTKKEISEVDDDGEEHEQTTKKKKSVKVQGRHSRAFLGIDLNIDISDTSRSVRQSSRLAQIKIKEQADPKLGDENRHVTEKPSKKPKKKDGEEKQKGNLKKKKKSKKVISEEDIQEEEPVVEKKKGRRKKKKKNPVRAFNERDPWKSSSGSSSEVEEEEEDHFEDIVDEEEDIPVTLKSDHEFSPESDIEGDEEVKPIRHARTAQKVTDPQVEEGEESKDTDDFACEKCGKKDHPEWILLCDTCDHGWHASCLRPSLMLVPEGDWHCPPCQHTVLVKRLQETLKIYDRDTKRRQNEELRRKRLAYVGISLDNVLPSGHQNVPREQETSEESSESSGSSSGSDTEGSEEPVYQLRQRRQGPTSYRFNEYDDLINSAIQDEVNEVTVINTGLLKPPAENSVINITKVEERKENEQVNTENISEVIPAGDQPDAAIAPAAVTAEKPKKKEKDESGEESSEEEDDNEEEEFPSVVPKRNNVLPRPGKKKHRRLNCLDDPSDDDDGSDEDFKGSSSEEEEEEEEEYSDDSDVGRRGRSKRGHLGPVRRSSRARRSRFDKEFINDDSEESDAPRRKKTKKLWSDSDSESDDSTWGKRKKKKNYSSGRRKFQRNKKFTIEDELSESEGAKIPKKKRQRKIKYGGLEDLNVEELPARRTRGKKINYQEVLGSDTDEEIQKTKSLKRAIIDDEDEFVADKEEEKDESRSSSADIGHKFDEEESLDDEEIEKSSEDEKEIKVKETEKVNEEEGLEPKPKSDVLPMKSSPIKPSPPKIVNKEKPVGVPGRRGRPPKAMIAPPPERLISEDEQYKAIVSKVPTIEHTDKTNSEVNIAMPGNNINDHTDPAHLLISKKIPNSSIDSKFMNRSPPLKIRSGVPVNAVGRKSPTLVTPSSEPSFFPVRSPNSGPIGSPPEAKFQYPLKMQRTLVPFQGGPQQFGSTRKSVNLPQGNIKIENIPNEEELDELDDEDLMDDIEEEEEEDEDDSDDDVLEEGEIPKKVARRMARMEERLQKMEDKKLAKQIKTVQPSVTIQPVSPGSAQTPAGNTPSDQKPPTTQPTQPLLRVVSPLKLMANPPSTLQSTFMHSGINPRMQMSSPPATRMSLPMRPPQPSNMMGQPVLGMDEGGGKRRGRGRGKKQLAQEKSDQEMMVGGGSGGSVIRGMLQQPQSYPPTHYPQQYPPPPRIPFNPQRMPRPPFHPGHHPMDPSPSGGGTISIKQEGGGHPQSAPVHIPNKPQSSGPAYHPPPHRFDSSIPRQPGYPPQGNPPPKSQYGSYPPPPATGGSYHYGNYPTPMPAREEPQVYPAQQQYNEQYGEPQPSASAPAPASSKGFTEEESGGEFGGLVSYFSSQREDDIDT
ncbi:remodeling and spacing factor 1-like isoform X2 [Homalodisca vitripennis]|uniref:remodeling and spacing factor 1-like isoform X2 n=1 Tax=Homalodisca vitripennis TaxID=197043 RepID=UPI001EEBF6FF|nr:remodeling and spacing factor 1-like isoform X2 [Homalodisca vitripennis]